MFQLTPGFFFCPSSVCLCSVPNRHCPKVLMTRHVPSNATTALCDYVAESRNLIWRRAAIFLLYCFFCASMTTLHVQGSFPQPFQLQTQCDGCHNCCDTGQAHAFPAKSFNWLLDKPCTRKAPCRAGHPAIVRCSFAVRSRSCG